MGVFNSALYKNWCMFAHPRPHHKASVTHSLIWTKCSGQCCCCCCCCCCCLGGAAAATALVQRWQRREVAGALRCLVVASSPASVRVESINMLGKHKTKVMCIDLRI